MADGIIFPALLPRPRHIQVNKGHFWADPGTLVDIRRVHGLPAEGYRLATDQGSIRVEATTREGVIRALAALIQLLPPEAVAQAPKLTALPLVFPHHGSLDLGSIAGFFRPHASRGIWQPDTKDSPHESRVHPWEAIASPIGNSRDHQYGSPVPPARDGRWPIPNLAVSDHPDLPWRGLLLDCARHYFPRDMVFRVLDHMAWARLNVLHWHLSDDQGFRFPVPSWPRLTEIGAWRGSGDLCTGGFYTDEDIGAIRDYAAARGITIVPELDVPGHAGAMIAAYPFLGCTGKPMDVPQTWGVLTNFLCPGKDSTLDFLDTVISRVAALFPGSPLHLGGDEVRDLTIWDACPHCAARRREQGLADSRALEGWFMDTVVARAAVHGVELILWDDCAAHWSSPGKGTRPLIQSWHHGQEARQAAEAGSGIIASTATHAYLDMFYHPPMPKYWIEPLSSRKAWDWDPCRDFPKGLRGLEAALWTEYCPTPADLEWKLLPRLLVLAEKAWHAATPPTDQGWEDYRSRFQCLTPWFAAHQIRWYPEPCLG